MLSAIDRKKVQFIYVIKVGKHGSEFYKLLCCLTAFVNLCFYTPWKKFWINVEFVNDCGKITIDTVANDVGKWIFLVHCTQQTIN